MRIEVKEKKPVWNIRSILLFFIITVLLCGGGAYREAGGSRVTCDSFATWRDAQDAYESDPETYSRLDGGGVDGVVCEDLPGSPVFHKMESKAVLLSE